MFNDNVTNPQPVADFQAMSSLETYTSRSTYTRRVPVDLFVNKYAIPAQFASYKTLPLLEMITKDDFCKCSLRLSSSHASLRRQQQFSFRVGSNSISSHTILSVAASGVFCLTSLANQQRVTRFTQLGR